MDCRRARSPGRGAFLPSYVRASESLAYLTHLQMSPRELELCPEGMGAAYTLPDLPAGHRGPHAQVCYVEADAVLLHFRDRTPWHEEKVFCTWRQTGDTLSPPRYWTADGPWDTHLAAVETLAETNGLRTAEVVVCLGDGAPPLWTLLTALAPAAVQVLDWYHVHEHLATLAATVTEGEQWHQIQRVHLRDGLTRHVLKELGALTRAASAATTREAARQCLGYLWRHRRRLDYASVRAH